MHQPSSLKYQQNSATCLHWSSNHHSWSCWCSWYFINVAQAIATGDLNMCSAAANSSTMCWFVTRRIFTWPFVKVSINRLVMIVPSCQGSSAGDKSWLWPRNQAAIIPVEESTVQYRRRKYKPEEWKLIFLSTRVLCTRNKFLWVRQLM